MKPLIAVACWQLLITGWSSPRVMKPVIEFTAGLIENEFTAGVIEKHEFTSGDQK